MSPMKDVTLNQREQARLSVPNSVLEYQVPIAQAAELLGVSQRHGCWRPTASKAPPPSPTVTAAAVPTTPCRQRRLPRW